MRALQAAEQRTLNGERTPIPPRVIREASPITEQRIERYQQEHTRGNVALVALGKTAETANVTAYPSAALGL